MAEQHPPIAGYDELPLGALQHRVRSLTEAELRALLDYERGHADRAPVVDLLVRRLGELEAGAEPSPGPEATPADTPDHSRAGSPVPPSGPAGTGRPTGHGTRGSTGKGAEHSE